LRVGAGFVSLGHVIVVTTAGSAVHRRQIGTTTALDGRRPVAEAIPEENV
jgi:hypothetical protein